MNSRLENVLCTTQAERPLQNVSEVTHEGEKLKLGIYCMWNLKNQNRRNSVIPFGGVGSKFFNVFSCSSFISIIVTVPFIAT